MMTWHPWLRRALAAMVGAALGATPGAAFEGDAPDGLGALEALGKLPAGLAELARTLTGQAQDPGEGRSRYKLFGNPDDTDEMGNKHPLLDRMPVVVVHGYSRHYSERMLLAGQLTWRTLRARVRGMRRGGLPGRYPRDGLKFFFYYYQPRKPYPDLAREFADRIAQGFFPEGGFPEGVIPPKKIVILAHSAGALLARYAATDPRLKDRVHAIISLAGAHRGSIQASLATAHGLERRPGMTPEMLEALAEVREAAGIDPRVYSEDPSTRVACEDDARCRVVTSLAYDNYDGAISDEMRERFGITVNQPLREFNEVAPLADRIVAFHGDVGDLGTRTRYQRVRERGSAVTYRVPYEEPTQGEKERQALAAFFPAWSNADPVIHLDSGSFASSPRPLRDRVLVPDMGHTRIFANRAVLDQVLALLKEMAAEVKAEEDAAAAGDEVQGAPGFQGLVPGP